MLSDTEEYKQISRERRVKALAEAVVRRGQTAGIPDKYLLIDKKQFKSFLFSKSTAAEKNDLSDLVYEESATLLKYPFITIDGGDILTRKKVGFSILFRIIACDHFGKYVDNNKFLNKLKSFSKRDDFVSSLKNVAGLFISELNFEKFNPSYECGVFYDELLSSRIDSGKTTILSFPEPIGSDISSNYSVDTGEYLKDVYSQTKTCEDVLRIKVKRA